MSNRGLPAPVGLLRMQSKGGAGQRYAEEVHSQFTHISEHPFWCDASYEAAIVMGNSPAMNTLEPGQIPGDVLTIGVNRSLRCPVTPKCLIVRDGIVFLQEQDRIQAFVANGGHLVVCSGMFLGDLDLARHVSQAFGSSVSLADISREAPFPCALTDEIRWSNTSPADALQLAVLAGCTRIGLIGVDFNAHTLRAGCEPSHFFGDGVAEGATGANPMASIPFLQEAREWALAYGAEEVVNLSPVDDSPFTTESGWPRATVGEFTQGVCVQ